MAPIPRSNDTSTSTQAITIIFGVLGLLLALLSVVFGALQYLGVRQIIMTRDEPETRYRDMTDDHENIRGHELDELGPPVCSNKGMYFVG